jgi:two-component system LytT family response regulator
MGAERVTPEPIRTLIVDDEPAARAALQSLLAADREIEVIGECADGRSAVERIEREHPDLVFLDVQMPGMSGFDALGRLEVGELPEVVFVTAYDEYALRAFEVHAADYLLKPFSDDRFHLALTRAKRQVRQRRLGELSDRLVTLLDAIGRDGPAGSPGAGRYLRRFVIKSGGRATILAVRDIDWIAAEGDYVKIHAGKISHLLRETMRRLETQLDPARFVRIHRSTIVNIERIKEIQPYFHGEYVVLLNDGTSLKLARGYRQHLETALGGGL